MWRVLPVLLLLSIGSTLSAQVYFCGPMEGDWKWSYDNSEYSLVQDNSGKVSGFYTTPFCPGQSFPISGTISNGSFNITVTGINSCPGGGVAWLTYTGYLGQPGCNFAYGSWKNSSGYSGGFGQNNAYPSQTNNVFAKPVDVPTSETSIQSGAWNPRWAARPGTKL